MRVGPALMTIDFTAACSPATALATLPHTSVEATTRRRAVIVLLRLCAVLAASGYADGKRRHPDRCLDPAQSSTPNTNENRFQ